MSDRLVREWTSTSAQAFGATGVKGDLGERFVAHYVESLMHTYDVYGDDYDNQVAGIDIRVYSDCLSKSFTADIKNNINDRGVFYVEVDPDGWLFAPHKISDRIWHCSTKNGMMAWYERKDMQDFITTTRKLYTYVDKRGKSLAKIAPTTGVDFITRTRVST